MAREYENFDVTLTADGPVYHATVADLTVTFSFPLETHEIEPFLEMFGKSPTRKGNPQLDRATAVGRRLFDTLFVDEVRARWDAAEEEARRRDHGLRLRLDLSDAYDLVTLPWEYLYQTQTDSFIALSSWTPVVRHLDVHEPRDPIPIDGPLQVLVMISDPIERRGTLDVEREWQQLNDALADAVAGGEVALTRLPDGKLDTLQFALLEKDYHVFHFIGHGEFSEADDDGVLVLEDDRAREVHVSGRSLGNHLRDAHALRLVVLNNCEGAATSESDPFAGSAQSLLRKGIPAIVAMQFEITDRAAIEFAKGFYRSLAAGLPVDGALAEARKTLSDGVATRVEFGAPVLYMASEDGNLFDAVTDTDTRTTPLPPPLDDGPPKETPPVEPGPRPEPDDTDDTGKGIPLWGWIGIAAAAIVAAVILFILFGPGSDTDTTTGDSAAPTETTGAGAEGSSTSGADSTTTQPGDVDYAAAAPIDIAGKPIALAVTDDTVWVSTEEAIGVTPIERANDSVGESIAVSERPDGIVIDTDGSLWVVDVTTSELWHLDPVSGDPIATIPMGERPSKVALGEGFVWVVNEQSDELWKIDPAEHGVTSRYAVGDKPVEVIVADGFVWVANHDSDSVTRLDPATGATIDIDNVGDAPLGLAFEDGSLWVGLLNDNAVARVDAASLTVTARIPVGSGPDGVAVGGGSVWVANALDDTVSRIDVEEGAITQTLRIGIRPDAIAYADGEVWVTTYGFLGEGWTGGSIYRLEPTQ